MKIKIILLLVIIGLSRCTTVETPLTVDKNATEETQNLLQNIKAISQKGFMFGHQDDQAYGVGWRAEEGRSDVKLTSGKYPAVHGWDLGKDLTSDMNIDSVKYADMKRWIKDAYNRGGINTVSFHMDNLTTGKDSWDRTPSTSDILPGGSKNAEFNEQLDLLADFITDCENIPMIFRPWHEHNGDWFWWGKGNCTEEEFIQLYRYTVEYLRDTKRVHQLLYVFSPDRSRLKLDSAATENYLYGYPGDDYVDIIGIDNYKDVGRPDPDVSDGQQKENFLASLKLVTKIANEKNKVAALSETGFESIIKTDWYTDNLLNPIKENSDEIKIGWVLVWRNSNLPNHYYVPYPGHAAEADFKLFEQDPYTFFESDLGGNIYQKSFSE